MRVWQHVPWCTRRPPCGNVGCFDLHPSTSCHVFLEKENYFLHMLLLLLQKKCVLFCWICVRIEYRFHTNVEKLTALWYAHLIYAQINNCLFVSLIVHVTFLVHSKESVFMQNVRNFLFYLFILSDFRPTTEPPLVNKSPFLNIQDPNLGS